MPKTYNILICLTVSEKHSNCMERIKPPARLVNSFRNIVGRIPILPFQKSFLWLESCFFKRIVILCKWHCAGIKPDIHHFRHAPKCFTVLFKSKFIYIRFMQIKFVIFVMWKRLECKFLYLSCCPKNFLFFTRTNCLCGSKPARNTFKHPERVLVAYNKNCLSFIFFFKRINSVAHSFFYMDKRLSIFGRLLESLKPRCVVVVIFLYWLLIEYSRIKFSKTIVKNKSFALKV